jgi:hypothetical protein
LWMRKFWICWRIYSEKILVLLKGTGKIQRMSCWC